MQPPCPDKPELNPKSETRSTKQIQISKRTMTPAASAAIDSVFLEFWSLRHSDLFRISDFVLRISIAPCLLVVKSRYHRRHGTYHVSHRAATV
jgi:hypothetical protein